jgi:hypothetical protein
VHDYFDILGVARDARPNEIRRACCRRAHVPHPDIWDGDTLSPPTHSRARASDRLPLSRDLADAAIDFVDLSVFVDAIRAAFFASTGVDRA